MMNTIMILSKTSGLKTFILTILFLFFSSCVFCQNKVYFGLFPTIDISGNFNERFSYNSYLFSAIKPYTFQNDALRILYCYAEQGFSYKINSNLSFTNAYVFERQEPFENIARNEHRLFQQISLNYSFKRFELKNRLRFDERFIQNIKRNKFEFFHRLRYLIGAKVPINSQWYCMGYSEFFFNTSPNENFRFNENWSTLQLAYQWNENNAIEFGYLFIGWIMNGNNWLNQHYLQTTWVSKFNFKK